MIFLFMPFKAWTVIILQVTSITVSGPSRFFSFFWVHLLLFLHAINLICCRSNMFCRLRRRSSFHQYIVFSFLLWRQEFPFFLFWLRRFTTIKQKLSTTLKSNRVWKQRKFSYHIVYFVHRIRKVKSENDSKTFHKIPKIDKLFIFLQVILEIRHSIFVME